MGIFSCCFGSPRAARSEAEVRHARIVEIYRQAEAEAGAQEHTQAPPPAYKDIAYDATVTGTTVLVDEKLSPFTTQPRPQTAMLPRPSLGDGISRPSSPQTSIYSVPSTRLTDITSTYTGATVTAVPTQQGDSPRSSMAMDSAPPSYYDGRSLRERSRSPTGHRQQEDNRHPVSADNWLDRLIQSNTMLDRRHLQ